MITKELIFYFVRKVITGFSEEWQKKIKGVTIHVHDNSVLMGLEKPKQEILGYYDKERVSVSFFVNTIQNYVVHEKDVYVALQKVESVVEHELLHAIGLDHEAINAYKASKS